MGRLNNYPISISYRGTEIILRQMQRCICEVINENCRGTGFFCCIPYKNTILKVMITCNHCINENYLKENNIITIKLNSGFKKIKINDNRKLYSNKKFGITIIEIKSEDEIDDFLEIDKLCEKYDGNDVYIIQSNNERFVSYGKVRMSVNNDRMMLYCSTERGTIGSPVLNTLNNKLIGIYIGDSMNYNYNIGKILKYPIIDFNNDNNLIIKYKDYKDNDFSNLKLISSGSYVDVYSAFSLKDEAEVCLKKINLEKMKLNYELNELKDYQQDLNNEINILQMLSFNNNSVKYYGNYDNKNEKVIIMEKCVKIYMTL